MRKASRIRSTAFLFPGQGSQSVGMLSALHEILPGFEDQLQRLDTAWRRIGESSLLDTIYGAGATDESLTDTRVAQPAIGLVSLALVRTLHAMGSRADFSAGHSFGELTALAHEGAFDDHTFLELAMERGRLMAEAANAEPTAMLAINVAAEDITETVAALGLVIASENAPKQTVVAGGVRAIECLAAELENRGLRGVRLRTSGAFHSPWMAPASTGWRAVLERSSIEPFAAGRVLSNVDAAAYDGTTAETKRRIGEHLLARVRWVETIEALYARGVRTFVEVGPGNVLTELTRKILGQRPHEVIALDPRASSRTEVEEAIARLTAGVAPVAEQVSFDESPLRDFFASNERVMESIFAQQKLILAACSDASIDERTRLAATVSASNERLLHDFLETQRRALEVLGGHPVAAPLPSPGAVASAKAVPIPAPKVEPPQATDETEGCVRTALVALTGFPPSLVTLATKLEDDLGLDSITMVELACQMQDRFPKIAELHPGVLKSCRTFGDLVDLVRSLAVEAPEPDASGVRLTDPDEPEQGATVQSLAAHIADRLLGVSTTGGPSDDARLEEDLLLDVFERERLANELTRRLPELATLGRELLTNRTIGALIRLSVKVALATSVSSPAPPIPRFVPVSTPMAFDGTANAADVLLIGVRGPIIDGLAAEGRARGMRVSVLEPIDGSVDDIREALWARVPADARPTVIVVSATAEPDTDGSRAVAFLRVMKALVVDGEPRCARLGLLSHLDLEGSAAVRGMLRALSREWSSVPVRLASFDGEAPSAARILDTLGAGPAELQLHFCEGTLERWSLQSAPLRRARRLELNAQSLVLAVGGGRGITAEIAIAMAERYRCAIAVIGRTAFPDARPFDHAKTEADLRRSILEELADERWGARDRTGGQTFRERLREAKAARELWQTRDRIEKAGGRFIYERADASREDELGLAITRIRRSHGRIDGVVHGAGIIDDALLMDKSEDRFLRVVQAKVASTRALRRLVEHEPLKFAFLMGSISSYAGTAGQTDYAAANEVLNTMARDWNRARPYPVRALVWSVWSEVGLASPALKRQMERRGIDGIRTEDGVKAALAEIEQGDERESVVVLSPRSALTYALSADVEALRAVG